MLRSSLLVKYPKRLFLLPLTLLTATLSAQDETRPRQVRFILLGEVPGPKLPGHENHLLHLPAEALPPFRVSVLSGEKSLPFLLPLETLTDAVTLDGSTPELELKKGNGEPAKTWLTHPMPTAPLSLGVLSLAPEVRNWNQPNLLLLNDTPEAFPAGTVRFVNVSEHLALVQIGDPKAIPTPKIFGVPAGKSIQKPFKAGNNRIRVGYLNPGKTMEWIFSNTIQMRPNQRLQAFFSKAQGKNPNQLVKVHFTPEDLPEKP